MSHEPEPAAEHPYMPGLHDPREKEIGAGPHLWVQHKGTDLCADFHCACGAEGHIDQDFVYTIRCPACGQLYEVATHLRLYPVGPDAFHADSAKIPEMDDEDEE